MDVRQQGRDLVLLLKQDRKAQVIFGVVILLLIWAFLGSPPDQRRRVVEVETPPETGRMDEGEGYEDLVTRFSKNLEDIQSATQNNLEANKMLKENLDAYEERTAEIFKKIIERMADLEQAQASREGENQPVNVYQDEIPDAPQDSLQQWGSFDEPDLAVPEIPPPAKIAVIGAGDSVRVRLIAGVNAPTDGTPYPVLFELVDDIIGPDGSTLPLGNARLIAAAQGSLADQRALFRITKLSMRYPDGSRNVVDADGWIVGEDGLRGMEGILIDPLGKALAGTMIAGSVRGLGEGISDANSVKRIGSDGSFTTYVDGDTAEYALGKGLKGTGERYAKFIDERAELLVPHIRVMSGRNATAVFAESLPINGLYETIEEVEYDFQGLD